MGKFDLSKIIILGRDNPNQHIIPEKEENEEQKQYNMLVPKDRKEFIIEKKNVFDEFISKVNEKKKYKRKFLVDELRTLIIQYYIDVDDVLNI